MLDRQTYERILRVRMRGRALRNRLLMLFGYLCALGLWVILIARIGFYLPMILLIPLSMLCLVLLTWKYTAVEYEYTVASGQFYLAKIFGKRRRRSLLEFELTEIRLAAPYVEEYVGQAQAFSPVRILSAITHPSATDVWVIILEEEKGSHFALLVEMDAELFAFLRHYCPRQTLCRNWKASAFSND